MVIEEDVLEFWKLCEIIDFEKFNLYKENIKPIYKKIENIKDIKKLESEYKYNKINRTL